MDDRQSLISVEKDLEENIKEIIEYDIDKLCIGKEIVDALLLDIRLDVI